MSWEWSVATASSCQAVPTPTYSYAAFSYTPMSTVRYATPVPSPLVYSAPWAPAFTDASTLLPSNVTYTTYALEPNATYTSEADAYGQSAYAALWSSYTFSSTVPWSTTVSPTPVASSELIYPPPLYNRPTEADCLRFPSDFVWGVAGSAWQIEGGLQSEGRGPSLLDSTGALPNTRGVNDSMTGNMNYFLYKQDIARLAAIGMPYYSFSISWSRVVPFGKAGTPVNTEALDHYDELINTCLEYGVTPLVTLNHFDSPAGVNFTDPAMVDDFMYYSKQVATRYADRVPVWFTFNEPNLVAQFFFPFSAVTNMLVAHARFYHWYRDELGGRAQITMKFANNLALPLRGPDNAADVQGALRYQDFILGTMSNPLFLGQQYPDSVLDTPNTGLAALTEEEIALINGTADFWAFDPYVSQFAAAVDDYDACLTNAAHPAFPYCVELTAVQADGWAMGAKSNSYSYVAPQGVRQQLLYVWDTFRPSGVVATEFGFPIHREAEMDPVDQRYDLLRTLYYQDFLTEMLKSRYEDGVNVIGALAWSVADNNEFGSFKEQYGLQTVNRTDGRWTRQYKRSMFDYVDFMRAHVGE